MRHTVSRRAPRQSVARSRPSARRTSAERDAQPGEPGRVARDREHAEGERGRDEERRRRARGAPASASVALGAARGRRERPLQGFLRGRPPGSRGGRASSTRPCAEAIATSGDAVSAVAPNLKGSCLRPTPSWLSRLRPCRPSRSCGSRTRARPSSRGARRASCRPGSCTWACRRWPIWRSTGMRSRPGGLSVGDLVRLAESPPQGVELGGTAQAIFAVRRARAGRGDGGSRPSAARVRPAAAGSRSGRRRSTGRSRSTWS